MGAKEPTRLNRDKNESQGESMSAIDAKSTCRPLWEALAACPPLEVRSPERDHVWLVVRDLVCTRSSVAVTPMGSESQVLVTADYASDELIAAMSWLHAHEEEARRLGALELFVRLRGVATRGSQGSARAAQADALRGITGVGRGQPIRWGELDGTGAA